METKYMCDRCGEKEGTVSAYESDNMYCEECAGYLEAQAEAYADSLKGK